MAELMAAPMAFELAVMWKIYPIHHVDLGITGVVCVIAVVSWYGIRLQTVVDDDHFIRSKIPHHAGVILMCEIGRLNRPELHELC